MPTFARAPPLCTASRRCQGPEPRPEPCPPAAAGLATVGDEGWLVNGGWRWVRARGTFLQGQGGGPSQGHVLLRPGLRGSVGGWQEAGFVLTGDPPSSRVLSCGGLTSLGWAALALESGPGPRAKVLRLPSGPSLAPRPGPHCSRVLGSAPSCGPLPTATPAPLSTHGHGNFGHLTCHLAQHSHPTRWAPPAPTPLGGQVSWAGHLSRLQRRGLRVILAPSLPTAPPTAPGTGGTRSLRPSSLKGRQTPAGPASHTGWPGHCLQVGDLSCKESSCHGQLAPGGALRQGTQLTQHLCTIQPSIHSPTSCSSSRRSRQAFQSQAFWASVRSGRRQQAPSVLRILQWL